MYGGQFFVAPPCSWIVILYKSSIEFEDLKEKSRDDMTIDF
jgi:hypothetical protein